MFDKPTKRRFESTIAKEIYADEPSDLDQGFAAKAKKKA